MGKQETPQKKQQKIVSFVKQHHSYTEAAKKFKVAKTTCSRICKAHGIESDFPAPQANKKGFLSRLFG